MTDSKPNGRVPAARLLTTAAALLAGLAPLPAGWALSAREKVQSPDPRASAPGGYYEDLVGGQGERGALKPLELAIVGNPIAHNRSQVKQVVRELVDDFLQFELKPGYHATFFGKPYAANDQGLRDRDYAPDKPANVYRIALLGASIDMGWGVATPETYENLLEDWLNAEADRRKLSRRFEVINFAVPAYGPAQRYDAFRRKALPYHPDLVLYSSTMIDPRLVEIHLGGLIKNGVDLKYDFFQRAAVEAGIDVGFERSEGWANPDGFKAKVKQHAWIFADAVLAALAGDCRSLDIPVVCLLVPRASRDDAGDARSLAVARQAGIAARHALPLIDLSSTFDQIGSTRVEIAPGDDHPNALGHRLLFEGLREKLVADPALARDLFEETSAEPDRFRR